MSQKNDKHMRPIWLDETHGTIKVIDQRRLPHELVIKDLTSVDDVIFAIDHMVVRGAPLIGVTAAYGVYLAMRSASSQADPMSAWTSDCRRIRCVRPTAVNLMWAVDRVAAAVTAEATVEDRIRAAEKTARDMAELEADNCRRIGMHGLQLIEALAALSASKPINILTHCNAGWLACIEYGTATAPIYAAFEAGLQLHVWVDETRPLNQGARLTAWELGRRGVPHTVVTDNAGGHLMQRGLVDMVIVGTDRTTRNGDVANKIGTYLKALAAKDNQVPFYVALPSSTFDWRLKDGFETAIEQRDPMEVSHVDGWCRGTWQKIRIAPADSPSENPAFDVTPARLVTGLITERGVCQAEATAIARLFPDLAKDEPGAASI